MPTPLAIDPEQFSAAIMELNTMSPCDGLVMTRDGRVKAGYAADPDTLCMLITAPELARMLTSSGLSSYTVKELKQWISEIDTAPLLAKAEAALTSSGN